MQRASDGLTVSIPVWDYPVSFKNPVGKKIELLHIDIQGAE
jgi:hypothetical protein